MTNIGSIHVLKLCYAMCLRNGPVCYLICSYRTRTRAVICWSSEKRSVGGYFDFSYNIPVHQLGSACQQTFCSCCIPKNTHNEHQKAIVIAAYPNVNHRS
jgi:hypothetical protein